MSCSEKANPPSKKSSRGCCPSRNRETRNPRIANSSLRCFSTSSTSVRFPTFLLTSFLPPLPRLISLFQFFVGESCDSDGRRESEKRDGVSKVSNGFHFTAASQSHVREEPLPQSHQIFQRIQIQVSQHRSHIRTRLLQRRS